jgi:hypothetical protein
MFSEDAFIPELATLLDQQVKVVTNAQGTDIHLPSLARLRGQDGKLDVFLGMTVIKGGLEILSPESFPRTDYFDIGPGLDKHPQIIGKVGSIILKVSLKLFLSDKEGVGGTGGGVFFAERESFRASDRSFNL